MIAPLRTLALTCAVALALTACKKEEQQAPPPPEVGVIDLQPDLAAVSEHFRADPRTVGGSLFRIYRDARFSNDKSPYKSWQGARLFHERRKQVPAPSFYIHLQPGESFVGAGLWHPEPATQRKVRHFIVDNPGSWKAAAHSPMLRKKFDFEESEKLVRAPRGFEPDFEFIDDRSSSSTSRC